MKDSDFVKVHSRQKNPNLQAISKMIYNVKSSKILGPECEPFVIVSDRELALMKANHV